MLHNIQCITKTVLLFYPILVLQIMCRYFKVLGINSVNYREDEYIQEKNSKCSTRVEEGRRRNLKKTHKTGG